MGSRGSFVDIFIAIPLIFAFFITVLVADTVQQQFTTELIAANVTDSATLNQSIEVMGYAETGVRSFNYGSILIIGSLIVALMYLAYSLPTSRMFIAVFIFIGIILIVVTSQVVNAFDELLVGATEMTTAANRYPVMITAFRAMPKVIFAAIILIAIVWYVKGRGEEGFI